MQTKNYEEAEAKLNVLLQDHPGDPRILFTLGQTASLWARDTKDDDLHAQRLNRALASYRLAAEAAPSILRLVATILVTPHSF